MDSTYLSLQRRVGANVLEETGLVVDPQLLLLLLALLVVLVQLADLRHRIYHTHVLCLQFAIPHILNWRIIAFLE